MTGSKSGEEWPSRMVERKSSAILLDNGNYTFSPDRHGGGSRAGCETALSCCLREIAAWRERSGSVKRPAPGRILRDEALVEIAHHAPTHRH